MYGAVAYREDRLQDYEAEIASWELAKVCDDLIACPKGGDCDKTYRLISEINTGTETVHEQMGLVLDAMEREDCAAHSPRIRINPPLVAELVAAGLPGTERAGRLQKQLSQVLQGDASEAPAVIGAEECE